MNETIKSVLRFISSGVIVLSSREMLMQIIKMNSTLKTSAYLIPPPTVARFQSEFELLQLLDVMYHTDSLEAYKTVVRGLLIVNATSSHTSHLIVSRMACASMLPEFRFVKREVWSSEDKREHDKGRIRRAKGGDGRNPTESAVEFGSGPLGSVITSAQAFLKSNTNVDSGQDNSHQLDAGCKPNDIEKLTNADQSNLLVVFDLSHTKSTNNKELPYISKY